MTTAMALNGQYNTPLTCAIFNGNVEIVKILLLHDAQENYPATSLSTPFFVACLYGRSEISNILLEKSPRLIDQEPSKCCEYRWCCTPMAAAVLCCNKPVRWRRQDTRSIFKYYFVWGVWFCIPSYLNSDITVQDGERKMVFGSLYELGDGFMTIVDLTDEPPHDEKKKAAGDKGSTSGGAARRGRRRKGGAGIIPFQFEDGELYYCLHLAGTFADMGGKFEVNDLDELWTAAREFLEDTNYGPYYGSPQHIII